VRCCNAACHKGASQAKGAMCEAGPRGMVVGWARAGRVGWGAPWPVCGEGVGCRTSWKRMGTQRADIGGGGGLGHCLARHGGQVVGWAAIFGGFDGRRTDGRDGGVERGGPKRKGSGFSWALKRTA
jgi:hypothetical protein